MVPEIYLFNVSRGKSQNPNSNVNTLKKRLEEINGKVCYLCKKKFERLGSLELEHKIPIFIGGKIFCLTNLELVCPNCHRKKTILDKKIINIMKKMKIIFKAVNHSSLYPLDKLKEIYLYLQKIIIDCEEKYNVWYHGSQNEDYIEILVNSNRQMEDKK
jgi:hypothetical protein